MQYLAELYRVKDGKRHSIEMADILASNDGEARRKAQEWAIRTIDQMIDGLVYLQVSSEEPREILHQAFSSDI